MYCTRFVNGSLSLREADPVYEPGHDRLTLVHYVITPTAVYLIDPERCIRARELFPRTYSKAWVNSRNGSFVEPDRPEETHYHSN